VVFGPAEPGRGCWEDGLAVRGPGLGEDGGLPVGEGKSDGPAGEEE